MPRRSSEESVRSSHMYVDVFFQLDCGEQLGQIMGSYKWIICIRLMQERRTKRNYYWASLLFQKGTQLRSTRSHTASQLDYFGALPRYLVLLLCTIYY